MYLLKLNGYDPATKVYTNPSSQQQENLPSPAFIVSSAVETNYEDYSSIENWHKSNLLDWARRRYEMTPLFYALAGANLSNYANLTAEQKLIGAIYFFVPYALRVTNGIVTDDEDNDNWLFLLSETKRERLACVEAMRVTVGQYIRVGTLTLAQTQQFFKDVRVILTWFEEANIPDFKQWLTNEAGSAYENDGFAQKDYYSVALKNKLYEIYNGYY